MSRLIRNRFIRNCNGNYSSRSAVCSLCEAKRGCIAVDKPYHEERIRSLEIRQQWQERILYKQEEPMGIEKVISSIKNAILTALKGPEAERVVPTLDKSSGGVLEVLKRAIKGPKKEDDKIN